MSEWRVGGWEDLMSCCVAGRRMSELALNAVFYRTSLMHSNVDRVGKTYFAKEDQVLGPDDGDYLVLPPINSVL